MDDYDWFARMNTIHILYPENRWVTAETIIGWAQDSYINIGDYGPDDPCQEPKTLEEAVLWLQDTGEITFAKR